MDSVKIGKIIRRLNHFTTQEITKRGSIGCVEKSLLMKMKLELGLNYMI